MYYKLDPETKEPVPTEDVLDWAQWFESAPDCIAEQTMVPVPAGWTGEAKVPTVFLGLDHNFLGEGPPILWETMAFGGPLDGEQERYATSAEAKAGHANMVARCKAVAPQP